jgi:formate--tetrahydrofolate ligase
MHGGVAVADLNAEDVEAVRRGLSNLKRHVENIQKFGVPAVVAINNFTSDTPAEVAVIQEACAELGVDVHFCTHWAEGGKGAEGLAAAVADLADSGRARFRPLYPDEMSIPDKISTVAREIYRAAQVAFSSVALEKLAQYQKGGFGNLPVCMAKTQYSFSADPRLLGAPEGHTLPVVDVRLSAGAGFVVALAGDIMTMPGLPRVPASERIHLDADAVIQGLF